MIYRQFCVPADEEILAEVGELPKALEGEDDARILRVESTGGESLGISYSAVGRSIRVWWTREGRELVDLYREGAVRMDVSSEGKRTRIVVESDYGECKGSLEIQIYPEISVVEKVIFS
ncbi:hypothetical protein [Streptomyces sp. ICBB 8177]|uniref:hypothetical protein n=1 Tax=Streptomyces sp. ICBB 8177 TaxID=563922 RepID=UPI0011B607F9|nr:hypothetical protein [Streptomyces sp. ICBB 8177]